MVNNFEPRCVGNLTGSPMKTFLLLLLGLGASLGSTLEKTAWAQSQPVYSQGRAETTNAGLFKCRGGYSRNSAVGKVTASDGSEWTVPAVVNFSKSLFANDLYNVCNSIRNDGPKDVDLKAVPIRTQAGGEDVYTAYVFADNYFELYIDGKLIAVDPVPFSPFNSSVIRFTAERPFTVAAMLVDWEENLGIGTEYNRGAAHHPGDGGFVAVIKDSQGRIAAITDGSWRAQTYYIAPLANKKCLKITGNLRDSRGCKSPTRHRADGLLAAHWPIPERWAQKTFDDTAWPHATTFTNEIVGVDNKRSYTNFTAIFDDRRNDAQFIWSPNLVLDNLVLVRKTIR